MSDALRLIVGEEVDNSTLAEKEFFENFNEAISDFKESVSSFSDIISLMSDGSYETREAAANALQAEILKQEKNQYIASQESNLLDIRKTKTSFDTKGAGGTYAYHDQLAILNQLKSDGIIDFVDKGYNTKTTNEIAKTRIMGGSPKEIADNAQKMIEAFEKAGVSGGV